MMHLIFVVEHPKLGSGALPNNPIYYYFFNRQSHSGEGMKSQEHLISSGPVIK